MIPVKVVEATALQHARMEKRERTFSSYIADIFEDNQDVWIQFCEACGIDLKDKSYCEAEREYSFKKIRNKDGKIIDKYIDLLMITRKEIIVIENKVDANESGMQLKEYREWAESVKKFKDRDKYYVLLYPEKSTLCKKLSDNNYAQVTYGKFVDILENNENVMKDKEYNDFIIDIKRTVLGAMQKIDQESIKKKINGVFDKNFKIKYYTDGFELNYRGTKSGVLVFKVAYFSHKNRTDISQADRFRVYCKIRDEFDDTSRGDIVENFGRYVEIDENNPDDSLNKLVKVLQYLISNYGEQYKEKYCSGEFLDTKDLAKRDEILNELKEINGVKFKYGTSFAHGECSGESKTTRRLKNEINKRIDHKITRIYYGFNFVNDGYIEIFLRLNNNEGTNRSYVCQEVSDFVKDQNKGSTEITSVEKAREIMSNVIGHFDGLLQKGINEVTWIQKATGKIGKWE